MKLFLRCLTQNTCLLYWKIPALEGDWRVDLHGSVFLLIFPEKAHFLVVAISKAHQFQCDAEKFFCFNLSIRE
jgi:hypothetical protein